MKLVSHDKFLRLDLLDKGLISISLIVDCRPWSEVPICRQAIDLLPTKRLTGIRFAGDERWTAYSMPFEELLELLSR